MNFAEEYKKLNEEQKKAVDAIEGPVMVVAGPGTGKTQILTHRIARIIEKTQINPENILAITYTEAGVVAMRKRLAALIGSTAYRVAIKTFHGFTNGIILDHPEDFSRVIGSRSITDVDQIRIIEELLESGKDLRLLRPFGDRFHYLKDIKNAIQKLKREGVDPEDFKILVEKEDKVFNQRDDLHHEKGKYKGRMKGEHVSYRKMIDKNFELAELYARYQKYLTDQKFYDFDDMIMETLRALKENPELLLTLQEQYQYVLVDEHQDTNNAQNRLLELLANYHENPNLFMVGDEKQAIFRFQGASLENFRYFQHRYPLAKLIPLVENYRSTQTILDAAASMIADNIGLKAHGKAGKPILLRAFSDTDAELYGLATDIKEKIKAGFKPEEIAVLYRTNKEGPPIERIFKKLNLPCRLESDQDVLNDPDVRKMVMILDAINRFGVPEAFVPLMYINIFNIEPLEIYRLSVTARKEVTSVIELIASGKSTEAPKRLYTLLANWKKIEANRGLLELFDVIMQDSKLLGAILKRSDAIEALDAMNVFLEQIRKQILSNPETRLSDFMNHLARMKEHGLAIRGGVRQNSTGAVRLMNVHRAKGLEFDLVYMINCADKVWGNRWSADKLPLVPSIYQLDRPVSGEDEDTDERNLFYVALTRARHEVIVSYARETIESREQLPSRFIAEIKENLVVNDPVELLEKEFHEHRESMFAVDSSSSSFDKASIRELFKERGFAVTHLNNYINCPWKYFFLNLLLVPKIQEKSALYGIAIHKSLEDIFRKREEGISPVKEYLLDRFVYHVSRLPFSDGDGQECIEKGTKTLGTYFDNYVETWIGQIIPEFKITGVLLTEDILLTGNIDRLDVSNTNHVVVTDYKTGRPRTRNDIEGNTRSSTGDIKRQLTFYKLLLDRLDDGKKFKMDAARVDFVEPDESGKFKNELFHIQPEEVVELENLIKEKADEIINLKFWNKFCDDKDCKYCALRKMMAE